MLKQVQHDEEKTKRDAETRTGLTARKGAWHKTAKGKSRMTG